MFAAPRGQLLDVDDLALDDDTLWSHDGVLLLQAVLERGSPRFVCPVPEPARTRTAVDLGLALVESWWHRDLDTGNSTFVVDDSGITVHGAAGGWWSPRPCTRPGDPSSS